MKKRILLSLVSFFAMTAMWATLNESFKLYFPENLAAGKTGQTATLTLNMKNTSERPIATWTGKIVLPAGVTLKSAVIAEGRYPAAYNPVLTVGEDGTLTCSGAEGVAIDGTDGAVATIEVEIAADATPGDVKLRVENVVLTEPNDNMINLSATETAWTIEEGSAAVEGDTNGDSKVNIADYQRVLVAMANDHTPEEAEWAACDVVKDGKINIADAQRVLVIMTNQ